METATLVLAWTFIGFLWLLLGLAVAAGVGLAIAFIRDSW